MSKKLKQTSVKDFVINKSVKNIETLKDLIELLSNSDIKEQNDLKEALIELDNLIGLSKLKEQVVNQILFFIQDLLNKNTFLHTVIAGPPGTGKTTIISIIAKIYKSLGFLSKGQIIKADRSDLIANYIGQTATKTKNLLTKALGSVFYIDEVYSLGSKSDIDSYSKECIDTINQFLSEHVDDIICIVAGYEDEIETCFFSKNPGLKRRFPWKFILEPYTPKELKDIFKKQLKETGWIIGFSDDYLESKITKEYKYFDGNGGSTKNLIDKCKITHVRKNFKKSERIISLEDFNEGLEIYLEQKFKTVNLCTYCIKFFENKEEFENCSHCKMRNNDGMFL